MKLVGANQAAKVTPLDELPGKSNYFIGNDPKKWRTDVPTYGKVKYAGVYPGIDLPSAPGPTASSSWSSRADGICQASWLPLAFSKRTISTPVG